MRLLDESIKTTIQQTYSRFLESRGLRARSAQKQMIAAVARTLGSIRFDDQGKRLGEAHVAVIEAGTGTGKTIAYLLATLPIAKAKGLKLIVSTATVALQEQLVNKDLPELLQHSGLEFRYTLAKGRGRYLCLSKAEQLLEQQQVMGQMALYADEIEQRLEPQVLADVQGLMEVYAAGQWDGDRDRLEKAVPDDRWQLLTSDHMQCTNRRCLNFSVCPFYRARESMDEADLIIANHDLVLADLSLGGGAILPEPGKTLYVFDEGHHLADKAGSHFSYAMRIEGSIRLLANLEKKLLQFNEQARVPLIEDLVSRFHQPVSDLLLVLGTFKDLVQVLAYNDESGRLPRHRFVGGRQPDDWLGPAKELSMGCARLETLFEQLVGVLKDAMEGSIKDIDRRLAEGLFPLMGMFWSRIQQIGWLADSYAKVDAEGKTPVARWVVKHDSAGYTDYECCSSPVSVAATLKEHLWNPCFGAVLTSATLTSLGNFDRVKIGLGLPFESHFLQLNSPFDYFNAATLEIPAMRSDPGSVAEHTEEVADFLKEYLINTKAVLVLFSSWKQMLTVLDRMDETIKNRLMAQGDYPKSEIIRRHRERIDQGLESVIFGLASFAEGVDLPGDYLTDVIITKLPFSVPDDPVDATMSEWIEQNGGNAFIQWTIPAASMRLTQAVGRLLRSEQDQGRVIILDRRLVTKRYGRQLLNALPPFRQIF